MYEERRSVFRIAGDKSPCNARRRSGVKGGAAAEGRPFDTAEHGALMFEPRRLTDSPIPFRFVKRRGSSRLPATARDRIQGRIDVRRRDSAHARALPCRLCRAGRHTARVTPLWCSGLPTPGRMLDGQVPEIYRSILSSLTSLKTGGAPINADRGSAPGGSRARRTDSGSGEADP